MAASSRTRTAFPGSFEPGYGEDLAAIHDLAYASLAEHAADLLIDELHRRDIDRGLVVELGCGGGALAERMHDAGFDVLGVDSSAPLVERARRRVPGGTFVVGSLFDAELPPGCVAVAAVGECINYLFDRGNTALARGRLLRRVHRSLRPGGVLLFDAAGPGRVPGRGDPRARKGRTALRVQQVHTEGDGWAVLVSAEEDVPGRLLTRHITTFRRIGEHYRRAEEIHRLRLLAPAELLAELRQAGFRARVLGGYGALRFPPGLRGFLARRG